MSKRDDKPRIGKQTEQKAGSFLFGGDDLNVSQFLDMRTRITHSDTMRAIMFYKTLSEGLNSRGARKIGDLIERLLISTSKGEGRKEAVEVLKQQFPKVRVIDRGEIKE